MKKFFTLCSVALAAISMNAQAVGDEITSIEEAVGQVVTLKSEAGYLYGPDAQNTGVADWDAVTADGVAVVAYLVEESEDMDAYLFRCVTPAGADYALWGQNPCYLNSQPEVGGVSFNLGKDQDIELGSTWIVEAGTAGFTLQSAANEGYLAGTTITADPVEWQIFAVDMSGEALSSVKANKSAQMFNILGQEVKEAKGLVIVNGKKTVIK